MAVLPIRKVGDPVLRTDTKPVKEITDKTKRLLKDMADTMYDADGVGLAAPQIGVSKKMFVVDIGEGLISLVNPEIIESSGEDIDEEGCLSIPGEAGDVLRAEKIVIKGLNPEGEEVKIEANGLLARALQHEFDHLNGVLFIDKMK
ncbi:MULTISPECIES: peptide deformylase [unclassified Candidatus Frackibacter]|uniref:peptide deformylase n=1 Tax=unclassified Candidatus Frackibacter TaxID=2648818 RepID=UPI0007939D90|nr:MULTISPECIES: peptide deformylase [unclassified Candidatus Frackibacter]KXS43322.1 MAG: peptide deformylase [Candidatus Frackibacter sp. T328-2]SDC57707.1 peptide deformylase [Candidatus Frackibacter sp. WG11]SEM71818.1 peptide deformylase [Candidatus Frackibacter sp. WG12]SFL82484.1 peptide deformylase [Candidatus Frackibacter sp. WG13]